MRIPVSTYRVQLTPDFGFTKAAEIVSYLHELGITDLYVSPIFASVEGSTHGYDVTDPTVIDGQLGGEAGVQGLKKALDRHQIGWVQDVVPNHMAFDSENIMLMDILENGRCSRYEHYFDIDWDHVYDSLKGRLLAPFLGKFYGETLEAGEISLRYDSGGLSINYYDLRFPLRIESYVKVLTHDLDRLEKSLGANSSTFMKYTGTVYTLKDLHGADRLTERYEHVRLAKRLIHELYEENEQIRAFIDENLERFSGQAGEPDSFRLLDDLLSEQNFRLAFWKVATEEINYRRFFTINNLICLRLEDQAVFDETHTLIKRLCSEDMVTGLRLDHIDGLKDPQTYLERLRHAIGDTYIIVEKILEEQEQLPPTWSVQGTTGYDFLNVLNGFFCRSDSERSISRTYIRFTGVKANWPKLASDKKRLIIEKHLAGNIDNLAHLLKRISSRNRQGNDITLYGLRRALVEVMAHFPVYRTYINEQGISEADRSYIEQAIESALHLNPDLRYELAFVRGFLLFEEVQDVREEERRLMLDFVMQFQQVTAPLMAKGVEDTCLYIYNRLLSLNEVGGNPSCFGRSLEEFHRFNQTAVEKRPHALNATATHDTKRGEDARLRLHVLSELPDEWSRMLQTWRSANRRAKKRLHGRAVPDKNDEYFLYQSLLAFWPFADNERQEFIERLKQYVIKAIREAKVHTAWLKPAVEYEDRYLTFIARILADDEGFLSSFIPFQRKVSWYGIINSLTQVLVKITCPGVPDIYQGCELWDLSMVDPDNRRPADFAQRQALLASIRERIDDARLPLLRELRDTVTDGRIKLFLTHQALSVRRDYHDLFLYGDYQPLAVSGRREQHLLAFARHHERGWAVSVAPRFAVSLVRENQLPLGAEVWEDTTVTLPAGPSQWRDLLTGTTIPARDRQQAADILSEFPVALLVAEET